MAAFNGAACGTKNLGVDRDGAAPERILGQTVSPSTFDVLGVTPLFGRTFTEAEDQVDNVAPVVLLSYRTWQRRFAGDPDILGKALTLDRVPTTIVGVMPETFDFFGDHVEFLLPLCSTRAQVEGRTGGNSIIGRLEPGVSMAQAQAEIDAVGVQLAASDPDRHGGLETRIEPLRRMQARLPDLSGQPARDYGEALVILQGAVAFVLLIACANVAGLLLARAAGRRHEVALRLTLGAGRRRVLRQLVIESLPIAVLGGALGLLLSWAGLALFVATAPPEFPRLDQVALDLRVLGFSALVVVATAVLFAVVPAWQASSVPLVDPLRETSRSATGGARRQRARRVLVTGQIALALVLLIGGGLLVHSFLRIVQRDLGADPSRLLLFDFRLPASETFSAAGIYRGSGLFDVNPAAARTFERVLERLETVPGVSSVAAANIQPFGSQTLAMPFLLEGRPVDPAGPAGTGSLAARPTANYFAVTRGFFTTMRIPVLQGREFSADDTLDRPLVMIVNEAMARQFFPNEDPIGRRVTLDFVPDERPREIVGVVGDTAAGPLQPAHEPAIYVPHVQQTPQFSGPFVYLRIGMYFVLRTPGDPLGLVPAVTRAVAEVDALTPVANPRALAETLDAQIVHLRLYTLLLGLFGAVAAVLAATGIYGVMAYAVAERTREIGIRMALGAQARDVLMMVVRQAVPVVVGGLALGLAGAVALTRVFRFALFEVTPTDPATYALVPLLLLLVAATACLVPARRAAAVDPTAALKRE